MTESRARKRFRIGWLAFLLGIAGLGAGLVGLLASPGQFYRSYLVAYLFWSGLALGCLVLALLYHLSGGAWGAVLLRCLEAGAWTIAPMAILFLPLLFGLNYLYPWTHAEAVAADPVLQHKSAYLNIPFFVARAAVYFASWIALTFFATRWSLKLDQTPDPALDRRLRRFSAGGLLLAGLTITFASVDWIMSLEPRWYSSVYGMMVAMGHVLAAFAFAVLVAIGLARLGARSGVSGPRLTLSEAGPKQEGRSELAEALTPALLNDFGSLLLAFVMLWAYLAFSQYLIIWSGNLPEETPWYLRRQRGGWEWVTLALIGLSFVLPSLLLLSRELKRSPRALALVAALLVSIRFVEVLWLVAPAFDPPLLFIGWMDFVLPAGMGGLWLAAFLWRLGRHPLLPQFDRRAASNTEADRVHP